MSQIVGRQVETKEVSTAIGKHLGGNKKSQSGFSDLRFMCGVACYLGHRIRYLHLDYIISKWLIGLCCATLISV